MSSGAPAQCGLRTTMKINQPWLSKSKVSIVYQINDANLATTLDSGESCQGVVRCGLDNFATWTLFNK
jgi:hypothetical protein